MRRLLSLLFIKMVACFNHRLSGMMMAGHVLCQSVIIVNCFMLACLGGLAHFIMLYLQFCVSSVLTFLFVTIKLVGI